MITAHQFYQEVNGKAYDLDGYYGAQCWDGAMYYSKRLGKPTYHCGLTGYVKDIWDQRKKSGILNYYDEVQRPFRDGDIIVIGECAQCPSSHIGIFRKDNGNGTFIILGQNQGGTPYPSGGSAFNQISLSYDGVLGGFRPRQNPKQTVAKKPAASIKEGPQNAVYRLYNPHSGDHLYTQRVAEARAMQAAGWEYEGVAWVAPSTGSEVWRLYKSGYHHYTDKPGEIALLKKQGWKAEKVAFRSSGSHPIYRMYNRNSGAHLLTASREEHNALSRAGWICEGMEIRY